MSGVLNVTTIHQHCSQGFQSFAVCVCVCVCGLFMRARLSASEEDAEPYVHQSKKTFLRVSVPAGSCLPVIRGVTINTDSFSHS